MSDQYQFEFSDWEEAFKMFYRQKEKHADICLVVSRAPYASGYWIERGAEPDAQTEVYLSVDAARHLEVLVRNTLNNTKAMSSGGVIGCNDLPQGTA